MTWKVFFLNIEVMGNSCRVDHQYPPANSSRTCTPKEITRHKTRRLHSGHAQLCVRTQQYAQCESNRRVLPGGLRAIGSGP